jgi:hypothetical protein
MEYLIAVILVDQSLPFKRKMTFRDKMMPNQVSKRKLWLTFIPMILYCDSALTLLNALSIVYDPPFHWEPIDSVQIWGGIDQKSNYVRGTLTRAASCAMAGVPGVGKMNTRVNLLDIFPSRGKLVYAGQHEMIRIYNIAIDNLYSMVTLFSI